MRNTVITLLFAIPVLLGLFASCGKGAGESARDSDTVVPDTVAAEKELTFHLYSDSICSSSGASVAIGTEVSSLPESMEGLYDEIERENVEGSGQLHFKLGDEYIFTAIDFGEGKVDLIMANTFKVKGMLPGDSGGISLSVPFSEVLALPGVMPEWCDFDDTGMWYWTCGGLWFAPDQSHLTPSLSTSLYNEEKIPVATDFDESVKVGYFGTGCPF